MAGYGASFSNRLGLVQGMGDDAMARATARRQAIISRPTQVSNDSVTAPMAGHVDSNGKWQPGTREALYAFGDEIQKRGYRVSENSRYNGGKKVTGGHSKNSQHYHDDAIDINWAAGTSKAEQAKLRELDALIRQYGLNDIFMAPGHYGHRHVSIPRR